MHSSMPPSSTLFSGINLQAGVRPELPRDVGLAAWAKAAFDFVIVLIMCAFALPVTLVAALLVKLTSSGPAFYTQVRCGRFGQPFKICKLRTMYHNCEARSGAIWSSKNDNRVTWIGRILRSTHLDELPQLWNVLRGEMNLIGPRPERPEFAIPLDRQIPGYAGRLAVKPGVSGLAQIQLPADSNLESVRNKLALDLVYVEKRGFWLDLRLMLGTCLYLVGFSYARVRRLMRLPKASVVPPLALLDKTDLQTTVFPSTEFAPVNVREQQLSSI
jgi:lipopolysaccharide/colanic/teichoic acid biosynthesis glycosyltransferase